MNFNAPNPNFDPATGPGSTAPVDFRALLAALGASQPQQQPLGQLQHQLHQPSGSVPSVPQWSVPTQVGQYQWQQPQAQPSAATFQAPLPQPPLLSLQPNAPPNQTQYNIIAQWAAQNQAVPQTQAASQVVPTPQSQPSVVQNADLNAITASFLSSLTTYLTQQQQASQALPAVPQATQQSASTQSQRQPTPVGSASDDESRLIAALRKSRTLNITFRQALDGLDGVNHHSAAAWKDYFLDNIHRFYAQSNPQRPTESASGEQLPASQRAGERHNIGNPPEESRLPRPHQSKEPRPTLPRLTNASSAKSSTMTPPEFSRRSPDPQSNTPLGTRRRRGSPVTMWHAGTRIPPWSQRLSVKPTPPAWEKNDGSTFTDADKTFFIHYLQWRMQNDPLVTKPELYNELAEHAPHHDADAWKKHWDRHPQLPDKLFIEGRNRAYPPTQPSVSRTADVPRKTAEEPACEGDNDSQPSDDDENTDASAPDKQASDSAPPTASRKKKGKGRPHQRVTEADLRAMALHMFENRSMWADLNVTRIQRWIEFAQRKENAARRSLLAWMTIEKTHANRLKMHLTELRKAATSRIHNAGGTNATGMSSQNKLSRGLPSSEQRIDTPSEKDVDDPHRSTEKTGSITPRKTRSEGTAATKGVPIPETTTERSTGKTEIPAKGSSADASNHSRKRHADEDIKAELDSPARKRPKEGPQEGIHEVIELSD